MPADSDHRYHPTPAEAGVTQTIFPHEQFLAEVFGGNPKEYEVSEARLPEVLFAIEKVHNDVSARERVVLALRFGLDEQEKKTYKEIGQAIGVGGARASQIKVEAIRTIRRRANMSGLKEHTPLPADSFSRRMLNLELVKDIPEETSVPLRDIEWSPEVAEELRRFLTWSKPQSGTLRDLLCQDLARVSVQELAHSDSLHGEIMRVTKRIMEEGAEAVLKPASDEEAIRSAEILTPPADEGEEEPASEESSEKTPVFQRRERRQQERLRTLMARALVEEGATDSVVVKRFIMKRETRLFGIPTSSWTMRAAIEYLFNHPEEKKS